MAGTHYAVNPQTGERIALIDGKWVPATPAGSSSGAPRLTEAQAKDGMNAKRMAGAERVMSGLEAKGYDAGLDDMQVGPLSAFGHKREYDQAAQEWADALLRTTSGANAPEPEAKRNLETYIPKFGDSPAVRAQKAAARARVERDTMTRAGPGALGPPSAPGAPQAASPRPVGPAPTAPRKAPGGFRIISVE